MNKTMKRWLSASGLAAIFLATISVPQSQAQYTTINGVISTITLSSPTNYAFRVFLNGALIGGCSNGFLYMNANNGNYQAYVATLLSAYAEKKTVQISYILDAQGFCAIGDMSVIG